MRISTGIIVTENAAERMLEAKINGINEMGKFITDQLQPGKRLSFFDPFKRNNTMTFGTIKKKKKNPCKIKTKVMSNESSRDLFSKIYLHISSWSCIMALLRKLDADIPPVDVPLDSAMTTDGMAFVHQIRTSKMSFEEFAIKLLCNILSIGQNSERINVVSDVYRDCPIKDIERKKRSSGNRQRFVGIESTCWN